MEIALSCEVETATGRRYTWHRDAPTANDRPAVAPSFDTQRGTGFGGGRLTLRRRIDRDWPDLTLGDTIRLIGADGSIAYEGWISALPRTTEGGNAITVELAGFMALAQDEAFTEVYVDRDLTRWQPMSRALRAAQLTANLDVHDFSIATDADPELPGLVETLRGPWVSGRAQVVWAQYDAGAARIGSVYYDFTAHNTVGDAAFQWIVRTSDKDDHSGTNYDTADLQAASGSGYVTPSGPLRFAGLQLYHSGAVAGTDGVSYEVIWRKLAVYGNHGLTRRGSDPGGFYVSDLIRNMAGRWAPGLDTSGVQDTSYVVGQAAYLTPTYPFDAWQDLNRLHLWELAVWEDKRLVYAPPSSLDEWDWEVRTSDPGTSVSLEGDQFPFNGVLVTFTDLLSGREQTIGPDQYPDDLYDDSEANPATSHGRRRFFPTTVPFPCQEADAVQVGRARFAEAIRAQARGSITTGPTIRDRAGNEHPAWKVRAGERVVIADLPNDRPRRITSTGWDGRRMTLATDNISRRMEAIFDARVPAARSLAGLG